jgi:hypothetical protein
MAELTPAHPILLHRGSGISVLHFNFANLYENNSASALNIDAVRSSVTFIYCQKSTRRNPGDRQL